MTRILSETFAPPITATIGVLGWPSRVSRICSSFSTRKPMARRSGGKHSGTATIEASSRWQVPKASLT